MSEEVMGNEDEMDMDSFDLNSILNELNDDEPIVDEEGDAQSSQKGSKIKQLRNYISNLEKSKVSSKASKTSPAPNTVSMEDYNALKSEIEELKGSLSGVNSALTAQGDAQVMKNVESNFNELISDPDFSNELISDVIDFEKIMPTVRKMHNDIPSQEGRYMYPEEILSKVLFRPLVKALANARQVEYRRKVMSGDIDERDNIPVTPKFESGSNKDARDASLKIARGLM